TKHLEKVFRVVAAVLDPAVSKQLSSLDVAPVDAVEPGGVHARDLARKLRRDALIGIEREDPVATEGQVLQGPAPLNPVRLERMLDDNGVVRFGNLCGPIGAACI